MNHEANEQNSPFLSRNSEACCGVLDPDELCVSLCFNDSRLERLCPFLLTSWLVHCCHRGQSWMEEAIPEAVALEKKMVDHLFSDISYVRKVGS